MSKFLVGVSALVGFPMLIAALTIAAGLYFGWVLSILWGWFIVPVFLSMPTLTVFQAWGIGLVFNLMFNRPSPDKSKSSWIVALIITPLSILLTGYFLRGYI